jgi:nitrite reductase/ring-hydroxylating ferredoxin subunit
MEASKPGPRRWPRIGREPPRRFCLGSLATLATGRPAIVVAGDRKVLIAVVEGKPVAFEDRCFFGDQLSLCDRYEDLVCCPRQHDWYRLSTGRAVGNGSRRLTPLPVEVEGESVILTLTPPSLRRRLAWALRADAGPDSMAAMRSPRTARFAGWMTGDPGRR